MGRAGENTEPPRHSHSCVFGSIVNPVVPGHVYINGAGFGSVCFGLELEKWMHGKGAVMQCCCCVGDCWCDSCSTCGSGTELLGQVCFLSRSSRRKREDRTRRSRLQGSLLMINDNYRFVLVCWNIIALISLIAFVCCITILLYYCSFELVCCITIALN